MADPVQNAEIADAPNPQENGQVLVPADVQDTVEVTTPVWNMILERLDPDHSVKIYIRHRWDSSTILEWETTYIGQTLYIEVPHGSLPEDADSESFTGLLGYATEVLRCIRVVIYFSRERNERDSLIRRFRSLGLFAVPAESTLLHVHDHSQIYMVFEISEQ